MKCKVEAIEQGFVPGKVEIKYETPDDLVALMHMFGNYNECDARGGYYESRAATINRHIKSRVGTDIAGAQSRVARALYHALYTETVEAARRMGGTL